MSKFQSRKFKDLREKYYELLKKEGFEDIEDIKTEYIPRQEFVAGPINKEHYEMAVEFLHVCMFKTDEEKRIWEMYCDGLTIREIAGASGNSIGKVHYTLKRLETMMLWRFK